MTLHPETALRPGSAATSPNSRYRLLYQTDGNLVLYGPDGPLWDSGSNGRGAGACIMQADGNLVLYGPNDEYVWDTETDNNPGSRLVIQDDGNAVIYRPDGSPLWATETCQPPGSADSHVLQSGSTLTPTHGIRSANGLYGLLYQTDGNLVFYGPDGPLWDSGTNGRGAGACIMQPDGNLVLYGPNDEYVWDTETDNNPGSRLVIQDDGNAVIYRPDGNPTWVTGTH
ncbi:curculin domain-containing protein [Arthrobacter sp. 1P04PC]|uniref:curculin domain-containing protein n=1 Tax=Micrococcaceae TaxID=1268 RepID=UPI0039A2718F